MLIVDQLRKLPRPNCFLIGHSDEMKQLAGILHDNSMFAEALWGHEISGSLDKLALSSRTMLSRVLLHSLLVWMDVD